MLAEDHFSAKAHKKRPAGGRHRLFHQSEDQCQDCGARYDAAPLVDKFLKTDRVPACRNCAKGRLKHATVSFGQSLPVEVFQQSAAWSRQADLFLAIGSSLVVSPAADLLALATRSGSRLVIINRDSTPLDYLADEVVRESIGVTLLSIDRYLD